MSRQWPDSWHQWHMSQTQVTRVNGHMTWHHQRWEHDFTLERSKLIMKTRIGIICTYNKYWSFHVKLRNPNQWQGSIPVLKKWGSGSDPRVHNMLLGDWSLRILGPIPEHSGIIPKTSNYFFMVKKLFLTHLNSRLVFILNKTF